MIYGMFTVYDAKAEAFLPPFILPKTTMAQRTFSDCANSDTHQFGANPEDYTLFKLGNWDDESGKLDELETPRSLGLALEYVKYHNAGDIVPGIGKENGKARLPQDTHIRSDGESENLKE